MRWSSSRSTDVILNSTAFKLHQATALLDRAADTYLQREHGVRYAPFLVLLRVMGEPSQRAVADALDVSRASITQRVAQLTAAGLLAVESDPRDVRANILRLTEAGLSRRRRLVRSGSPPERPRRRSGRSRAGRPAGPDHRQRSRAVKHLEFGDGPERILWLHGGNVAGWMWGEQLPAFADYRSIVPDLPGLVSSLVLASTGDPRGNRHARDPRGGGEDSSAITRGSLQRGRAEIRGAITAVAPGDASPVEHRECRDVQPIVTHLADLAGSGLEPRD